MSLFPAIASIALALIPVFIWIDFLHGEGEKKSIYVKTFLFGTFSVVPVAVINYFFANQVESQIAQKAVSIAVAAVMTGLFVGMVEELAKNMIVRVVDKRHPEHVQTIGAALKLSICAGLGFSFVENILYFYMVWTNPDTNFAVIFSTVVFRSVFTMCMHMIASGIFGYYFGLGKFAADITEQARWSGNSFWLARLVSKATGRMLFQTVRELKNLKGLFIAMVFHASFNSFLELQYKLPPISIVLLGAIFVFYLMKTKSGHLFFSALKRRPSSMAPRDEDVVLELLGMWTREKKYEEVIKICDRLLERDPDSNVVRLFRAKAKDDKNVSEMFGKLFGR